MIYPVRVYDKSGSLKREYSKQELVKRHQENFKGELELPFPKAMDSSIYLTDSYNMYPSPGESLFSRVKGR